MTNTWTQPTTALKNNNNNNNNNNKGDTRYTQKKKIKKTACLLLHGTPEKKKLPSMILRIVISYNSFSPNYYRINAKLSKFKPHPPWQFSCRGWLAWKLWVFMGTRRRSRSQDRRNNLINHINPADVLVNNHVNFPPPTRNAVGKNRNYHNNVDDVDQITHLRLESPSPSEPDSFDPPPRCPLLAPPMQRRHSWCMTVERWINNA